jgi:nitroreductase
MSQVAPQADTLASVRMPPVDPMDLLATRRSVAMTMLTEPGPTPEELRRMLTVAARVPDHGALEPWRFIVIEGEARLKAGERLAPIFVAENTTMEPEKREKFAGVIARIFTHAPLTVIVASRVDPTARIPVWEQELSSGAVCMNLLHAANALGFAGSWLTGWPTYSKEAHRALGVRQSEKIAGMLPIGTPKELPPDRRRPDIDTLVTRWRVESREGVTEITPSRAQGFSNRLEERI